jgi:hypothetical protein
MKIGEAIINLGFNDPNNFYSSEVLEVEIPPGYYPVRVGHVHPLENYMGIGRGSLYTNKKESTYKENRLVVRKVNLTEQYFLEE